MKQITINDLLHQVRYYSIEDIIAIKKAYEYADHLHAGQMRQSGEPYITHPLSVALILAEMNADADTICAALLHDTIEDTEITKEDIAREFNETIAMLVDGVTKISKLNFSSKEAQNNANTRKIITGITKDVRIILIKLADRLHNMRTLEYKSEFKQKENALETMEIFVPLAYFLGAYRIKSELEDLSLKYLKPNDYERIKEQKMLIESESHACLEEMLRVISRVLHDESLPFDIKLRTKNIYGIYKRLEEGYKTSEIHDLLALKISLEEVYQCYLALGLIHKAYHPVNEDFKDYICNPKTNMYQGLHTTLFGLDNKLVQAQIRTFEMDKVASFGLPAYWSLGNENTRDKMQHILRERCQFFDSLVEIDQSFGDNQQFVSHVKKELFADKVYVYTTAGEVLELPKGANPIDFAYRIHTDIGNQLVAAVVNENPVPLSYTLQNGDRIRVITDALSEGPKSEWQSMVATTRARKRIREYANAHANQ